MCFIIQSDILKNSVDNDIHCEHTGQMGAGKYLREAATTALNAL